MILSKLDNASFTEIRFRFCPAPAPSPLCRFGPAAPAFVLLAGPPAHFVAVRGASAFLLWLSPRSISIRQLHVSPRFHLGPIYLIIFQGSYSLDVMGNLILRGASCLDAFSTYPFRT
jgi:hypothetical protein